MIELLKAQVVNPLWEQNFPGQIDWPQMLPEVLNATSLEVSGHELRIVDAGHSDTDASTFVHVASLDLVVAGDIVYNDVHQYLAESTTAQAREAWKVSIKKIEDLRPHTVISGHKRPGAVDSAANLHATIDYLDTYGEVIMFEQRQGSLQSLGERIPASSKSIHGVVVRFCCFPANRLIRKV